MVGRVSGEWVYRGKILQVSRDKVELPGGATADLEIIRHPGASAVVPLHPDGSITLIRQYRYAADGFILEVPAGKLDPGESPEICAMREIVEEAGVRAARLHPLGWIFTTPGFTDEKIHLFAATGLTPATQALDEDEVIEVVQMPLVEALRLAAKGGIRDGKSLCAIYRTAQEIEAGRLKPSAA
jgi:ADP-ribose pyrophosphatase